MKKNLITLTAALAFATAAVAVPTTADARGGGVAAGIIGGLAAGAIIGGALARPYYYDYPYPAYYYGPGPTIMAQAAIGVGSGRPTAGGARRSVTEVTFNLT